MAWKNTTNRFVGFYDIMGFKSLVHRNSHGAVLSKMNKIKNEIISPIEMQFAEFTSQNDKPKKKLTETGRLQTAAKPVIFSDSILIVTNGNTAEDLDQILFISAWLLQKAFGLGIPIKGAISLGKFTADFDNSIYFGQPLIDAYLLQDELVLYGVIADHTIEDFIAKKKCSTKGLAEYKTPLKSGKVNHLLSDWIFFRKQHMTHKKKIQKLYLSVSGKPRQYVDNTIEYFDFLINKKSQLLKTAANRSIAKMRG